MPIRIEQLDTASLDTVLATDLELDAIEAKINSYNTVASEYDPEAKVYKKVVYNRTTAGNKKYMETTLSNLDSVNKVFQTLTIKTYAEDGITEVSNETWNLTYESGTKNLKTKTKV